MRYPLCQSRHIVGVVLVCVSSLVTVSAFAQQVLSGLVIDSGTGAAIIGAAVELSGGSLQAPLLVRSDNSGRYSLPLVAPGEYTIQVLRDDYFDYETTLRIRPRQATVPAVRLVRRVRVEQQVVVAAPPLLEARDYSSGIAMTQEQILELPMAQTTNFSAIVPSLSASAVTGHDNLVHLRGNELSLQMSVDNISFLDNTHLQFSPAMSPEVFDSVELLTGGFSPEFGSRFGGILDLHTRSGFGQRGHGSIALGGGSLARGNVAAQWGNRSGHWGYFFSAAGSTSDRFLNPPQPESFHNRGNSGQGMARLDHRGADGNAVRVVIHGGGSDFDIPNTGRQQGLVRDAFKTTSQETATVSWDRNLAPRTLLTVSAYQRLTRERSHPSSDSESVLATGHRHDRTYGAKADLSTVVGGHVVKTGLDLKVLDLDEAMHVVDQYRSDESGATESLALRSTSREAFEEIDFAAGKTGSLLSAYLQDEWQAAPGLVANFGVRVDRFEMIGSQTEWSPRVNLAYEAGSGLRLHGAYNRFFAPPPIEYLLLSSLVVPPGGDAQPVPAMTANDYEAGLGHRLGAALTVDLTGFYRRSNNAFETGELADTRVFIPVTFASDEARGLELSLRFPEIGDTGLGGFVGYSLGKTEFIGPLSGGLADEELAPGQRVFPAFDQRHTLVGSLRWRQPLTGFWVAVHAEYGSGTPVESEGAPPAPGPFLRRGGAPDAGIQFDRLPSHLRLDLAAGYDVLRRGSYRLSMDVHLENLTDDALPIAKESVITPIQYGQPRAVSARLRFAF